ncbi:hypothetical protein GHK45_18950 [Sinorhizobium meliloti]|uniref:Uncharacterized protein n=1 Tax=Rhizobium meliloti TaxID=382 RepID=A0A6A7ZVC9_RHIML|nr:hypothetical protein [Sinorhizobium meliloti]
MDWTGGGKPLRTRREHSHATCLRGTWSPTPPGLLLLFSGALLLWQMSDWQSLGTAAILPCSSFISHSPGRRRRSSWAAFQLFYPIRFQQIALHAPTIGAMGTMLAAFMMRPTMFRDGESLILGRAMAGTFSLVSLSTLLRISGRWTLFLVASGHEADRVSVEREYGGFGRAGSHPCCTKISRSAANSSSRLGPSSIRYLM